MYIHINTYLFYLPEFYRWIIQSYLLLTLQASNPTPAFQHAFKLMPAAAAFGTLRAKCMSIIST